jgi:hypothetical protein
MERGLTKPFLVSAEPEGGGEAVDLVVKPRAGYSNRPDAICKEIFSTVLAKELGIDVPEPVLADIPKGLEFGAEDEPESKAMIEQSYGLNYATVHLGNGWKTWTQGANPRGLESDVIESAFAYDALVQNVDRKKDNPNLLWKGDRLVALDFDRAFAYLGRSVLEIMPMLMLKDHVLHSSLVVGNGTVVGNALWENWEGWRYSNQPEDLISGEANELPINNLADDDLPKMLEWLNSFSSDPEKFLQYITDSSI